MLQTPDLHEQVRRLFFFTFANAHLVQDRLYHQANVDGQPGIFGTAKPEFDEAGNLTGWHLGEGDEYHAVVKAFGLSMARVFAPTEADLLDKRQSILEYWEADEDVVFVVGVNEDLEREQFEPMGEGIGNHYVVMYKDGDDVYALDSWRTPGRLGLVPMSEEVVEANLFYTHNAIYALTRG